ncbi:MAG: hypothetical protein WBH51_10950 [Mycolicibacter algericus]|uniref:hypothetical protein n=1 Tax=Mycolicibacter algericus TaxID=1288388 RepID=UPI003C70C913
MSEPGETSAPPQSEAEFLREERETTRPFDPELMQLVHFINIVDGAEVGLTLYVGGCVVSGMLISIAQFYRLLIKDITDPARASEYSTQDSALAFAEFYRPQLEAAEKIAVESRNTNTPPPTPRHIHLRDAQTFIGGAHPLTHPVWRGRLSSVDGWSIGNFGPTPPLDT